jgi:hypothetical protein
MLGLTKVPMPRFKPPRPFSESLSPLSFDTRKIPKPRLASKVRPSRTGGGA